MSGSKLVLTVFIILIVAGGGFLGFYFYINKTTPLEQAPLEKTKPTFQGFDQTSLDSGPKDKTDLGSFDGNTGPTEATTTSTPSVLAKEPQLRLISPQPIAGADFIIREVDNSTSSNSTTSSTSTKKVVAKSTKKTTPVEFIRYVLRSTGNVLETSSSTATTTRITNTTLPKIHEAYFNVKGDGVIIRDIIGTDSIRTRLLSLKTNPENATSTILLTTTSSFPDNITELAVSTDRSKIFYTKNSGTRGTVTDFTGVSNIPTFTSTYREWLPQWIGTNTILLNTKPSSSALGYLYTLDTKTSAIKKVFGGVLGLTTLASTDNKLLVYADTSNNTMDLNQYNLKDGSERKLFASTLPEKCVWGNKYPEIIYCAVPKSVPSQFNYPDDWYMGVAHFDDNIWRMNLKTGENKLVVNPARQVGLALDIKSMKMSKNDDYLIFEDKNTLSLWGLPLSAPYISTSTIKAMFKVATSTASTTQR